MGQEYDEKECDQELESLIAARWNNTSNGMEKKGKRDRKLSNRADRWKNISDGEEKTS